MSKTNSKALATLTFRTDAVTGYRVATIAFPSSFRPGGFEVSPERTVSLGLSRGDLIRVNGACDCVFETTGEPHSAAYAVEAYNLRAMAG